MASDFNLSISNLDDEEQQRQWGAVPDADRGGAPEDPRRRTLDPTVTRTTRKESSGASIDDDPRTLFNVLSKLVAGGMRAGTGIAGSTIATVPGIGTALGAALGGGGEGLAELIEDPRRNLSNLDRKRMATEAFLTGIPLGKVYEAGRPLKSAIGGGLLSALGIGSRRAAEGRPILPETKGQAATDAGSVALGSGIGAVVGALGQPTPKLPIQGPPVLNPSLPKITDLEDAMGRGRGLTTLEEKALQEQLAKQSPTTPFFKQAQRYRKQQEQKLAEEARSLEAKRKFQEAEKAKKAAAKRVADATKGMVKGEPKASQTFSADIEGGKETVRIPLEPPKDETGTKKIILGPDGKPVPPAIPPTIGNVPSPKGQPPSIPKGPGPTNSADAEIARLKAELNALPAPKILTSEPPAPAPPKAVELPPTKPTATPPPSGKTLDPEDPVIQNMLNANGPDAPLPKIVPTGHGTMPAEPPAPPVAPPTGIPKPKYWDDTLAAIEDPMELLKLAEQPGGALRLARHYGAMKEAKALGLPVNDKAREAAAKAAMVIKGKLTPDEQQIVLKEIEDYNTKFPKAPKGKGKAPAKHQAAVTSPSTESPVPPTTEPPPTGSRIGPGQTAKAREAALAKRNAAKAEGAKGAEADKATADNLQSDLDRLSKMSPEERAAEIKRLKGEKGAINPVLMARIAGGLGGAALGAATDPLDNPLLSIAAGGAGGALAGGGLVNMLSRPQAANIEGSSLSNLWKQLPNMTRSNLLFSGSGLPANAVAGPWGGATLGALEEALGADTPGGRSAGWTAIRSLLNPINFPREFGRSLKPAVDRITRSEELGRSGMTGIGPIDMLHPTVKDMGKAYMAFPGIAMVMGDEAAGNLLTKAGVPEDRMMRITLRNEPESAFGRGLQHMLKTKDVSGKEPNVIGQLALPFNRTNMNVMERGLGNMPGIGLSDMVRAGQAIADPMRRRVAQQGIGSAVMIGSELIGESTDPETAKTLRKYVVNAAGPYSLQAAIGFTYGQARRQGKSNPALEAFVTAPADATPLPSFNLITDYGKALVKTLQGQPTMPKAAVPRIMTDSDPWGVGDIFNLFQEQP